MSRLPARRWLMVLALISVLSLSLAVSGSVGAQCTPRYDWPTYTVQPGDTLYRIALRYGTDSTTLAIANCLTDINRIEVGQVLRSGSGAAGAADRGGRHARAATNHGSYGGSRL